MCLGSHNLAVARLKRCFLGWVVVNLCTLLRPAGAFGENVRWVQPSAAELSMTAEPKAPAAAAIILSYEESDDGDSAEVSVHVRIKILKPGGLSAGTVEIPNAIVVDDDAKPDFNARTIHANGTVLPFVSSAANTTLHPDAEGNLRRTYALPDLQVGSIVEYTYHFASQNTLFTSLQGYYAPDWTLQRPYFVRAEHFLLRSPENLEADTTHWVANLPEGVLVQRNKNKLSVDLTDVAALPNEPFMPPVSSWGYQVRFFYYAGSRDKYWGESGAKVDDYWSRFDTPRKPVVTTVQELLKPEDSNETKLRKLYSLVEGMENTDLTRRRTGKEDGKSAKNSEDLVARKRGDSEELTLFFIALARAAGYKAFPMAVSSRDHARFDRNVLSWRQMDSLIAIVDVDGHEIYFDPGVRGCSFGTLAPWHAGVMGVSAEGKLIGMRVTPTFAIANQRTERIANLTLDENGQVKGVLRMTWFGAAALPIRRDAFRQDAHAVELTLKNKLESELPSGVQLDLTSLEGLTDPDHPLVANFTVSGRMGERTPKRLLIPAQFFAGGSRIVLDGTQRTQPVSFPEVYALRDRVTLHLPSGLAVESLPESKNFSLPNDANYQTGSQASPQSPQTLVIDRLLILQQIDYRADEYPALQNFFVRVASADADLVTLKLAS